MFGGESAKFFFEVGTCFNSQFGELVFFNEFVLSGGQCGTNWVSHESVHMAVRSGHPSVLVVVESAREHLLGERDEVRRLTEVPLLVCPERSGEADSSLDLINDEIDPKLLRDVLETLSEFGRELVITTFTHDRLNDDADNFGSLLGPLLDLGSYIN